jgi:RadC-like JAB domain-containing protein/uncharacterized protein DUF5661
MFSARDEATAGDYDSPDDALAGAASRIGAEWYIRRGDHIEVFMRSPDGYYKADLFKKGGWYHWPTNWPAQVRNLPAGVKQVPGVEAIRGVVAEEAVTESMAKKIGNELRVDWRDIPFDEFRVGIEEEQEHTDDLRVAAQIALDHLREDPRYYTKLKRAGLEANDDWSKRECVIHGRGDCSCPPRTRVPEGTTEEDLRAANEIVLFAEHTGSLYPEKVAIYKKLRELQVTNRYNDDTAWRAWAPWVASAAEAYRKEFGGRGAIPVPITSRTMEIAAKTIAEHHAIPLWRGEYDEIVWKPTGMANEGDYQENPRGQRCGPDVHTGHWKHRGGCCPGRPTCRYQRREAGLCHCEAYHYPHRSGSGRCVYGPEGAARMDRLVHGPPPENDAEEKKGVGGHEAREQEEPAGEAAAVPWVKLERDPERYRRQMDRAKAIGEVTSARAIYDLIAPTLAKEDQEVFLVLAIDARKQCRDVVEVARGGQSRVHVEIPIVMRTATAIGGEMFVVVHNHPTGNAKPSPADRRLTKAIEKAARASELVFADHVIVGMDQYYSFTDDALVKVPRA